jgi:lipopolysaccharide transport system permease protein
MTPKPVTTIAPSRRLALPRMGEVARRRELLIFLAWRDISARYRQSVLGVLWAVIQPLAMMAAFTLVFDRVAGVDTGDTPYALVALSGLVVWQLFARTLSGVAYVVVGNAGMVTKIYFPRLILPLATSLAALVDFAVAIPVLLAMIVILGGELYWTFVLLPAFGLMATAIALGIGLWLSAINVRFRDVGHAVPFLLQLWLFVTPVAYPLSALPDPWRRLALFNPMTGVVDGFRWSVLRSGDFPWGELAMSAVTGTVFLITGAIFFQSTQRSFADVV